MISLLPSRRSGMYWDDCSLAIEKLSKMNLRKTDYTERQFENRISTLLDTLDFNDRFIDQRSVQDVITRVTLFSSDHRPDMSIGNDGTAIEVKIVDHGNKVKQAYSQALFYRVGYRFVIVVLVDITEEAKVISTFAEQEGTSESQFVKDLAYSFNIFTVGIKGR